MVSSLCSLMIQPFHHSVFAAAKIIMECAVFAIKRLVNGLMLLSRRIDSEIPVCHVFNSRKHIRISRLFFRCRCGINGRAQCRSLFATADGDWHTQHIRINLHHQRIFACNTAAGTDLMDRHTGIAVYPANYSHIRSRG